MRRKLVGQPFQVLQALLERPGEVVTRDELRQRIWPDNTFVDYELALKKAVNRLREVLGDSAQSPRFIETIPRHGYRFIGPVMPSSARLALEASLASVPAEEPRPLPGAKHKRAGWLWRLVAGFAVVAFCGMFVWLNASRLRTRIFARSSPSGIPRLTEKDTIVLGDFANSTGDPVFDDTLKQGLRVQLEQSPFLNILSDQKVVEELRLMGRSPDERLTPEVAHHLCQRAGSKAVLKGSIATLGSHYVIDLHALACQTGDALANAQVEADSREHVLKALGDAAAAVRGRLGESLALVEKYDVPLEQATTPSLEALKAYSIGLKIWWAKGESAGLPFLNKAVDLDPNFAMAYARMGVMYCNLFQLDLCSESTRKAYELRNNISERERLFIEDKYYAYVTGETEKSTQVQEVRAQIYPQDFSPHNNLANNYSYFGRHEKGLEHALLAMQLDPTMEDNYITLGNSYICLNRLNEADAVLKQAEDRKLESEGLVVQRYLVAFLKNDEQEMKRLEAVATTKPGAEDLLLSQKEAVEAYYGRLGKSWEIAHVFGNSAKPHESVTIPALTQAGLGLIEAYFGEARRAQADAKAAVPRAAPKDFPQWISALTLAVAGDTAGAANLLKELDKAMPLDTSFQHYWKPAIRAAMAMDHKNPKEAIELLQVTSQYDLGTMGSMDPAYLRGQAYLRLGNGSAAAAEFEKIIEHPGVARNWPVGALAHLGLGRAYVLQMEMAKSRTAYQDFLNLWKDADSDIPIYKQAKAEYAKLQ